MKITCLALVAIFAIIVEASSSDEIVKYVEEPEDIMATANVIFREKEPNLPEIPPQEPYKKSGSFLGWIWGGSKKEEKEQQPAENTDLHVKETKDEVSAQESDSKASHETEIQLPESQDKSVNANGEQSTGIVSWFVQPIVNIFGSKPSSRLAVNTQSQSDESAKANNESGSEILDQKTEIPDQDSVTVTESEFVDEAPPEEDASLSGDQSNQDSLSHVEDSDIQEPMSDSVYGAESNLGDSYVGHYPPNQLAEKLKELHLPQNEQ